jgi:hypothetical protein
MVHRVGGPEDVAVCHGAKPAPWAGKAASYASSPLQAAQTPEIHSSPRSIFLAAERLVQIWSSNEQEFAELRALRFKIQRTRAYLASPGCHQLLGRAYLERMEKAHRTHLARLRANRREAWELVARLNAAFGPEPKLGPLRTTRQATDFRVSDFQSRSKYCWYA